MFKTKPSLIPIFIFIMLTYLIFRTNLPKFPHLLAYNLVIVIVFQEMGFYKAIYTLSAAVLLTLILSFGLSFSYAWHIILFFATFLLVDNEQRKHQYHRYIIETRIEEIKEKTNIVTDMYSKRLKDGKALEKKEESYNTLKDITIQFNSILSFEELLSEILKTALMMIEHADVAILFLVDTMQQELNLHSAKFRVQPEKIEAKKGDPIDESVFRERRCLLIEDIKKDFRFSAERFEAYKRKFRSVIVCPLIESYRVIGILRLESAIPGRFNSEDLRILNIISDVGAVSLRNAFLYKHTTELAITDSLTGLYLRGYFLDRAKEELIRCLREESMCTLLILDIDNFKACNDEFGHTAGDLVLKRIGYSLKMASENGICCRYGGEEFSILLFDTSKKKGMNIADGLRKAIKEEGIVLRRKKTIVTVSIGVAGFPEDGRTIEELITKADEALYKAKREGKDRVKEVDSI